MPKMLDRIRMVQRGELPPIGTVQRHPVRMTLRSAQAEGRFAETNDVFGNGHLYGSLRRELEDALAQTGRVYLMEVDVTGAGNLKRAGYEGRYIFIAPPSMQVLEQRLRERQTDDEAAIQRRLARAQQEMDQARADKAHVIVNTTVDEAVKKIYAVIGLKDKAPAAP